MEEPNLLKKSRVAEFSRPGLNPVYDVLKTFEKQSSKASPEETFNAHLNLLKKCSELGDCSAWKNQLPFISELAKAAGIDPESDLNLKVRLKQMELSLLFNAGKQALHRAKLEEKKATEAQMENNETAARQLFEKAQKLSQVGKELHDRLMDQMV